MVNLNKPYLCTKIRVVYEVSKQGFFFVGRSCRWGQGNER